MLESQLKEQLTGYLDLLEGDLDLVESRDDSERSRNLHEFLVEISELSPRISIVEKPLDLTPSFGIAKRGDEPRVFFGGLPLGHEFNSLVLALLQVSGRAPKVSDQLVEQIKAIDESVNFTTYVSLSCHKCPDLVQDLNIMAVLNPKITNTTIDGGFFEEIVTEKNIMAVPALYKDGEFFSSGKVAMEEILAGLMSEEEAAAKFDDVAPFDVLVIGGGPAGASAAVYAARKGIRTGIIADKFGGQVMETMGIENVIGQLYVEGPKLMADVEKQVGHYGVEVFQGQRVSGIEKKDFVEVSLENGAVIKGKTVIVATGAKWRNIGCDGEEAFKNKGVAYCPHCDGPLFSGKKVAVVGGGNSGVEAAIDLAGIVEHVTLLEFMPELKADQVLQDALAKLPNVEVITNAAVNGIFGEDKVRGLSYENRTDSNVYEIDVAGAFILIGLQPNTGWLKDTLNLNERGEIIVGKNGATSMESVYAAGDCTDSLYKQIIIAMGSGATAALGAFDELIRA